MKLGLFVVLPNVIGVHCSFTKYKVHIVQFIVMPGNFSGRHFLAKRNLLAEYL